VNRLTRALILPPTISEFEARHLARVNNIAWWFFAAHLPAFVALAWLNHTGPAKAAGLTLAVLLGPWAARRTLANPRAVSVVYGVTAMFMGGLLVHFGQGPCRSRCISTLRAARHALGVRQPGGDHRGDRHRALHHLVLWFALPRSVFNYDAPVWVVAVHAAFVVLEACATCFVARRLLRQFQQP